MHKIFIYFNALRFILSVFFLLFLFFNTFANIDSLTCAVYNYIEFYLECKKFVYVTYLYYRELVYLLYSLMFENFLLFLKKKKYYYIIELFSLDVVVQEMCQISWSRIWLIKQILINGKRFKLYHYFFI